MRISDWSSDVCSSDLPLNYALGLARAARAAGATIHEQSPALEIVRTNGKPGVRTPKGSVRADYLVLACNGHLGNLEPRIAPAIMPINRSEEHTSELQSLMRHSYAVFCLKKKTKV